MPSLCPNCHSPDLPFGGESVCDCHPPTAVISLPRISFSGDGKVDSAPTWWVVWGPVPPGVYFAEPSDGNTTAEPDPEHRPVSQMEMF